jgi:hypothetical protein
MGDRERQSELTAAQVRADPALQAEVQLAINHANDVSKAESIRKWTILDGELSEAGHVTSTRNQRTVIATDFAANRALTQPVSVTQRARAKR